MQNNKSLQKKSKNQMSQTKLFSTTVLVLFIEEAVIIKRQEKKKKLKIIGKIKVWGRMFKKTKMSMAEDNEKYQIRIFEFGIGNCYILHSFVPWEAILLNINAPQRKLKE